MNWKALSLRLHRWLALVLAAPLLLIIMSGLLLSMEPLLQRAWTPAPLSQDALLRHLGRHDPQGTATGLTVRPYDGTLLISGAGPDGEVEVDLRTGEEVTEDRPWSLPELFRTARQLHEHLLIDQYWIVTASTVGMLLLAVIGVAMGWPRMRNSLGGWHATSAWALLPLALLVPLTGLALSFGITFTGAAPRQPAERLPIAEAVRLLASERDIAGLTSLRPRGGRLIARIYDGQVLQSVVVTRAGLQLNATNWPRALHEGNWHAVFGSTLNLLASVLFAGLWLTGLLIWGRRKLRMRSRLRAQST